MVAPPRRPAPSGRKVDHGPRRAETRSRLAAARAQRREAATSECRIDRGGSLRPNPREQAFLVANPAARIWTLAAGRAPGRASTREICRLTEHRWTVARAPRRDYECCAVITELALLRPCLKGATGELRGREISSLRTIAEVSITAAQNARRAARQQRHGVGPPPIARSSQAARPDLSGVGDGRCPISKHPTAASADIFPSRTLLRTAPRQLDVRPPHSREMAKRFRP